MAAKLENKAEDISMVAKAKRKPQTVTEALHAEIESIPEDRRALLLKIVHSYREGIEQEIEDIDPRDSLRQALREVKAGKTRPIEGLWKRVGL
jgi:hypothetical protein